MTNAYMEAFIIEVLGFEKKKTDNKRNHIARSERNIRLTEPDRNEEL